MKRPIISALLIAYTSIAYASEPPKMTIGGKLDTQIGYVKQKNLFKGLYKYTDKTNNLETLGQVKEKYGVVNDTNIDINISAKSDLGFKYGGRIRLNADTSIDAANNDDTVADKTMIFVESKYGRLEGGAYNSASDQMRVSGSSIARATGGIDGRIVKWYGKGPRVTNAGASLSTSDNQNTDSSGSFGQRYITYPELPIDCDYISFANKITYITPKFNGLNFGISYTPSSATHGTVSKFQSVARNNGKYFEKLIDYAVNYENKMNGLNYKIGLTGEVGNADKGTTSEVARKNLNVWEAGATVTYKEFSIAGSYSDWGKSATPKVKVAGKKYGAKYWTAGVAFVKGNFGTSLTYFKSQRANVYTGKVPSNPAYQDNAYNKLEYIVLSTDYKLATGLLPYAELARFKAKDSVIQSNKGYVLITGMKLNF